MNFGFLSVHDAQLVQVAGQAEQLFAEHPNATLMMLRLFGELLAQRVAANVGAFTQYEESQVDLLARLSGQGVITREMADAFHAIRKAGTCIGLLYRLLKTRRFRRVLFLELQPGPDRLWAWSSCGIRTASR